MVLPGGPAFTRRRGMPDSIKPRVVLRRVTFVPGFWADGFKAAMVGSLLLGFLNFAVAALFWF